MESRTEVTSVAGCYNDLQIHSQQTTGMHIADLVSLFPGIIEIQ